MAEKSRLILGNYIDKDGLAPVILETRRKNYSGEWIRKRIGTGVKVAPKNWTGKDGRWIGRNDPAYGAKNLELERLMDQPEQEDKPELLPFIDSYIELSEASGRVGKRRLYYYKQVKELLMDFSEKKRHSIVYENMNVRFINLFVSYLIEAGYARNTMRTLVKIVKHFLRVAFNEGFHDNRSFQSEAWKISEEDVDRIYLTTDEIAQVAAAQMPSESLERVRDTFLLGCNLGLRYSDLCRLSNSNVITFEGRKMIRITQGKTGAPVVIPINSTVAEIMQKYDGFPPAITLEKFNEYVKNVCQIAKFPKWEQVSSHTMRRSFATNAYVSRVPAHSIMKITGHKSEASFLRYIRITREDHAKHIGDHPFFR